MNNQALNSIIISGENETVEFKTSFNDEVITSLVAFANTKGGTVYVGISDKGEAKGINVGKETIQSWVNEPSHDSNIDTHFNDYVGAMKVIRLA